MLTFMCSCPSKAQCYNDVYNIEYLPEWDWTLPDDGWLGEGGWNDDPEDLDEEDPSSVIEDGAQVTSGDSSETDGDQYVVSDDLSDS